MCFLLLQAGHCPLEVGFTSANSKMIFCDPGIQLGVKTTAGFTLYLIAPQDKAKLLLVQSGGGKEGRLYTAAEPIGNLVRYVADCGKRFTFVGDTLRCPVSNGNDTA